MADTLSPCPFCGARPVEWVDSAAVCCENGCGVEMCGESPDAARAAWNRRALTQEAAPVVPDGAFIVCGSRCRSYEASGDSLSGGVAEFRRLHGFPPDSWERTDPITGITDEGEITGICEGCERPILGGEKYGVDREEGCYTCATCMEESDAPRN